ncbi:hypothetical protein E2C01_076683 [Portunus trituberculatus]|uniref:Uncharacterized protein n=1 Tax=Portunus trituberculatus TaxID=210409 RepID=A0A5B7IC92_PORTR|nr:hypothetical protein [Portunus trituberculatus]
MKKKKRKEEEEEEEEEEEMRYEGKEGGRIYTSLVTVACHVHLQAISQTCCLVCFPRQPSKDTLPRIGKTTRIAYQRNNLNNWLYAIPSRVIC